MDATRRDILLAGAAVAMAMSAGPASADDIPQVPLRLATFVPPGGARLPFDPTSMLSLLAAGPAALDALRAGLASPQPAPPLVAVRLLAPIPAPARDMQNTRHGGQWFKGKGLDGHGPLGPWIVVRGTLDHDIMETEIAGIGLLRNEIKSAA